MQQRVIYVFTHDSIGLGEDGPTHQAVEHAASLRLIPHLDVWRPADTVETLVAWAAALERRDGPTALLLSRQKDVKRLFAYSSVEHMGIITFAFGMGGPVANFAALLHMTVHSLTKSAIFFTVGHAAQKSGTQIMDEIRGLITSSPMLGWGLILGTLAILGMPPFGVFTSEFLILVTAISEQPWATPFLLAALGLAFAAVFSKVQPMVFGATTAKRLPVRPAMVPVYLHLALVLMLGLWIPPFLADWYRQAARLIG